MPTYPYFLRRLETRPDIPSTGRFLLPMCLTQEELLALVSAVERYNRFTGIFDYTALLPILQAIEYIGRPEEAECYSGAYEGMDCLSYPPFASFIEYLPNDPYDPNSPIPPNYLLHAWWKWGSLETGLGDWIDNPIAGAIEFLTQYKPTDAMVWLGSLPIYTNPIDLIEYILGLEDEFPFPFIKIHVSGKGSIRLTLLSMPIGGRVVCEVDQLPNIFDIISNSIIDPDSRVIDTDRDITSFPLEQWPLIGTTLEIEEEGDHIVYVCPLPRVNDGADFFGYGAGLRSVELCGGLRPTGFPEPSEPPDLEGVSELKPEFRFTEDCGLEYRLLNQLEAVVLDWTSVSGWTSNVDSCFHGQDGTDGEDGNNGEDGTDGKDGANGNDFAPDSPSKPFGAGKKYVKISQPLVEPENSCDESDKDRLWGAIKALVYRVHAQNLDFLDEVSNFATPSDAYDVFSKFLPLLGALSPNLAIELALKFAGNFKSSYTSAVTDAFLYEVIEDLFCAAYSTCEFDLEDFVSYVAGLAGGSFNALSTTFLDITSALAGQTTGSGIYGALSWWQFHVLGLGEKWGLSPSIDNLINSVLGAGGNQEWKAYADECYTHSGSWTIVLDFAGDYVAETGEIVYKGMYNHIKPYTGGSQGTAILENRYGEGIRYTGAVNSGANRELRVSNSGALFGSYQVNARKESGTATYFQFGLGSPSYGAGARNITTSSYQWTVGAPLVNANGSHGSTPRLIMVMSQQLANQSCLAQVRYIRITGSGELPKFA
jgi:hypothetical protein